MKRILIHAFCLSVAIYSFSCNNTPAHKNKIVCKDSSYHEIKIDTIKGYEVRTDLDLKMVQNEYLFADRSQLNKVFNISPGSIQTPIDFDQNIVGACVIDNRVGQLVHGNPSLVSTPLKLSMGNFFIKDCGLNIPYAIQRMNTDTIPMEHLAERYLRKYFLFQVPKKLGLAYVYFNDTSGGMSYKIDLPFLEK